MITAEQSATIEATTSPGIFDTGLDGTVGVRIDDNQGDTVVARTTTDVVESDTVPGVYIANSLTVPGTLGQYTIIFDDADGTYATEDLLVIAAGTSDSVLPAVPAEGPDEPALGPCTAWIAATDITDCYTDISIGSDNEDLLDQVAIEASMLLYELSAQRFSGQCDRTVRPCRTRSRCTGSWGSLELGIPCGCGHLDKILLPGYPVTSIISVKIDGTEIDAATWTLHDYRWLVRVRDPADPNTALFWPACQNLDLPDTEDGTFSVRYLAGVNPPPLGQRAAAELAGQLYYACPGVSAGTCRLPVSVQRVTRQGVSMEVRAFTSWAFNSSERAWKTGLPLVDAFLNGYNPTGARRPPLIWSPDGPQFARRMGTPGS